MSVPYLREAPVDVFLLANLIAEARQGQRRQYPRKLPSRRGDSNDEWLCSSCRIAKPRYAYARSRTANNGLQPYCKDCQQLHSYAYRRPLRGNLKALLARAARSSRERGHFDMDITLDSLLDTLWT